MSDGRREALKVEDAFVAWLAANREVWCRRDAPDSEDLRRAFEAGWAAAREAAGGKQGGEDGA